MMKTFYQKYAIEKGNMDLSPGAVSDDGRGMEGQQYFSCDSDHSHLSFCKGILPKVYLK